MLVKIVNSMLVLIAVFMGLKQGWAMVSGTPQMLEMFGKWHVTKAGLMLNGCVMIVSALLILHPRTFVWGNFLMAAGILLIICFHLLDKDLKGVMIELPFLFLNLIIIYLQYPYEGLLRAG